LGDWQSQALLPLQTKLRTDLLSMRRFAEELHEELDSRVHHTLEVLPANAE
jgi:hypothetical protein